MPTHASKTKRLRMSVPNAEPGVVKADAIRERMLDTMGTLDNMPAVPAEMATVALPIASVANVSIPTAKFSVEMDLLLPFLSTRFAEVNCPKSVEPRRQHAMKHEKTVPYGVAMAAVESLANFAKYELTALLTAGGQFSTKMYIADSKRDCIAPTSIILGSDLTTFTASLIVGFTFSESLELLAAFSFHNMDAINPPKSKNPVDTSNGPVGPL